MIDEVIMSMRVLQERHELLVLDRYAREKESFRLFRLIYG